MGHTVSRCIALSVASRQSAYRSTLEITYHLAHLRGMGPGPVLVTYLTTNVTDSPEGLGPGPALVT